MDTQHVHSVWVSQPFGWMFGLIAAIFALGVAPPLARWFYPSPTSLPRRLAAPVIFGLLALAGFLGEAVEALAVVVALGTPLILVRRWQDRRRKPTRP